MKKHCKLFILSLLLLVFWATDSFSEEPQLIFVSSPDWHYAERELDDPVPEDINVIQTNVLNDMVLQDPNVGIFAGDLQGGHWSTQEFVDIWAPNETTYEAILNAGDIVYSGFKDRCAAKGISPVLVCIGDHEVGDNPWAEGEQKSLDQYAYREAFANAFTIDQNSNWIYPNDIGTCSPRPTGTIYESTSYAVQMENVLFVNVDLYHQDDPNIELHPCDGSVTPDMNGAHLTWLDDLLSQARQQSDIDYIVVQGHTPVLAPVRNQSSSGRTIDYYDDSDFWKTLRRYEVDLYIAGEVHATTVSKDPYSNIVQVVCGGPPGCSGYTYLIGQSYSDKLELTLRRQDDANKTAFDNIGTLSIDKSSGQTILDTSGGWEFLDQQGLIVHYPFDETSADANAINNGSFGTEFYNGVKQGTGTFSVDSNGQLGKARTFADDCYFKTTGGNPITDGRPRTVAAWIKTSSALDISIAGCGSTFWGNASVFNVSINNGTLRASIGSYYADANQSSGINDASWHHVAVVVPDDYAVLGDVKFYIDGNEYTNQTSSGSTEIFTYSGYERLYVGKRHYGTGQSFIGTMDDFGYWARGLEQAEIKALINGAQQQRLLYTVSDMEELFKLYRDATGTVMLNDKVWTYEKGLSGASGSLIDYNDGNGNFAFVLDSSGNGVATIDIEAESGTWGGGASKNYDANASGNYKIGNMHNTGAYNALSGIDGGTYGGAVSVVIRYANGGSQTSLKSLYVNGVDVNQISFPQTGAWNTFTTMEVPVTLASGTANTIKIQNDANDDNWEGVGLDKYSIPLPDPNLLTNPGFEVGLTGWKISGNEPGGVSTDVSHNGSNSFNMWSSSAYTSWLENPVADCEAGSYYATMWTSCGGTWTNAIFQIYQDSNLTNQTSITADTNWVQYQIDNIEVSAGNDVRVCIWANADANAWFYFDDFELVNTGQEEHLTNPGFEDGNTGWTTYGTCSLDEVNSPVNSGSKACKISSRSSNWTGAQQDIQSELLASGQGNYTIQSYMKLDSGTSTGKLCVRVNDDGGNHWYVATASVDGNDFTQITGVKNITWTGTLNSAIIYTETTAGTMDYYLDDFGLRK